MAGRCVALAFLAVAAAGRVKDALMACETIDVPEGDDARVAAGGIVNMDPIINGDHVLAYAWGHTGYEGKQITAWSYDPASKKIHLWYAKPDRPAMAKDNRIGWGMKSACNFKLRDDCPDLEFWFPRRTYGPGGNTPTVRLGSYGEYTLSDLTGKWRLHAKDNPGCYLEYIYICSTEAGDQAAKLKCT
mmetsp:Transcript_58534/g.131657  ORF Transcript_58534/g.131657 Transcript_58534/m.131657 type:complete len:188 (-) Transcript_58534:159-722(-)